MVTQSPLSIGFHSGKILKWAANHSKDLPDSRDRTASLVSLHWQANFFTTALPRNPNDLIVSFCWDKRGLLLGMKPALLGDFPLIHSIFLL